MQAELELCNYILIMISNMEIECYPVICQYSIVKNKWKYKKDEFIQSACAIICMHCGV